MIFDFRLPILDWGEKQMHDRIWMPSSSSRSDNRKLVGMVAVAVAFVMCGAVGQAQQPTKIPGIGFLMGVSPSIISARVEAFRQGLRELGHVEGKNVLI